MEVRLPNHPTSPPEVDIRPVRKPKDATRENSEETPQTPRFSRLDAVVTATASVLDVRFPEPRPISKSPKAAGLSPAAAPGSGLTLLDAVSEPGVDSPPVEVTPLYQRDQVPVMLDRVSA